jgi:hypothetical protein
LSATVIGVSAPGQVKGTTGVNPVADKFGTNLLESRFFYRIIAALKMALHLLSSFFFLIGPE